MGKLKITCEELKQEQDRKVGERVKGYLGYSARMNEGDDDGLVVRSVAPTPSHRVLDEKYDFLELDQVSLVEQGAC